MEGAERILAGGAWPFSARSAGQFERPSATIPTPPAIFWERVGRPSLKSEDLDPAQPIGRALPVFATAPGAAAAPMARSRVAHNHWVLDRLAKEPPGGRRRRAFGLEEIEALIKSQTFTVAAGVRAAENVLADLDASVSPPF